MSEHKYTGLGKVDKVRLLAFVRETNSHGGQTAWVTGHLISSHTPALKHKHTCCKLSKIHVCLSVSFSEPILSLFVM